MKRLLYLLLACATVIVASGSAQTACGNGVTQEYECPTQNCNQIISVTTVPLTEDGFIYYAGYVSCCNHNYLTYYNYGSECINTELRSPDTMHKLSAFASEQPILLANCDGHYFPYEGIRTDDSFTLPKSKLPI